MSTGFTLEKGEAQLALRDVQVVSFDILIALVQFCSRHGLKLYLCGGTLLGAVRHKGFIPWDDDVDLFMSRPDYDRFIELCKTETIRDDLEMACWQNGGFLRPFVRVYRKDTRVLREYFTKESGAMVWVDILPVDGLPDDRKKLEKLFRLRYILNKINMTPLRKPGRGVSKVAMLVRLVVYPFACLIGAKNWARLLEALGKSRPFEKSGTVGCLTGGRYGAGEAMPKDKYVVSQKMEFEGRMFDTMSCWKEYLSGIYGDYMTPPPEDKRVCHLDFTAMPAEALKKLREQYADMYK